MEYTITKRGSGDIPEKGDRIKIKFLGYLGDEVVETSNKRNQPFVFQVGEGQVIKGWDEAFLLFPEGTEANLKIPPSLAYGNRNVGKIPPNSMLNYNVVLEKIIDPPVPFDVSNLDTFKLESGLQYLKVFSGNGEFANPYRDVTVEYTGYIDDVIFDSSINRGFPFTFRLGVNEVIKGWDEGISKMKVGDKFRFILPPDLAYGVKGFPPSIPGNSILVFDIELIGVE